MATVLTVSALALGVGLSTAMFSILWGTVLRGLPFKDAGRLVRVETISQGEKVTPTDEDFLAWRRGQRSFDGMGAWLGSSFNLSRAGGVAERCNGAFVSANLFSLVQVSPVLGRDFSEADEAPGADCEATGDQRTGDPEPRPSRSTSLPFYTLGFTPRQIRPTRSSVPFTLTGRPPAL